jgi:2-C-methyl-D-erythritol 2,4-cyclodiphosphate synthase/2-C-methyl-D-erythritol 4-phosphate cytidylyltransferase
VKEILVVAKSSDKAAIINLVKKFKITKLKAVVSGGEERQDSVFIGINFALKDTNLIIHDAARPLVTDRMLRKILEFSEFYDAVTLCASVKDTVKRADKEGFVKETVDREKLFSIQTPQVFKRSLYMRARDNALKKNKKYTDDCQLIESIGEKVSLCQTQEANFKVTFPEDLILAEAALNARKKERRMRVGHGYDLHRLVEGRKLIIGGVNIPYVKGLTGHSDADVLIHAIIDALLGSVSMGDIGKIFSDKDPKFANISSTELLRQTCQIIKLKGHKINNIDSTLILQEPKISPYIDKMRDNISRICKIPKESISIKATTEENCGSSGKGESASPQRAA